jgi:decaprenyl-phosphate phosphoribosyltransferase
LFYPLNYGDNVHSRCAKLEIACPRACQYPALFQKCNPLATPQTRSGLDSQAINAILELLNPEIQPPDAHNLPPHLIFLLIEYLKICRIDHWLKNVFIVFGHAVALVLVFNLEFGGVVSDTASMAAARAGFITNSILSLIPVCLIASSYYILNEILDAPFDAIHPLKKFRGIPAGKVKVPILWGIMAGLLVAGFGLAWILFPNRLYIITLAVLMGFALLYNINPIRLKDKAFLDVISESINNPLRLLLGWYAVVPIGYTQIPPLSIIFAWWFFGALLMTGKRYSEYRFIADDELSGQYRKSFKTYNEQRLIMAMITYACLFCFCTGIAMASLQQLNNLVLIFPMILLAVIAYFRQAMKESSARLEPEQLLKNPWIISTTALTGILALLLLYSHKNSWFEVKKVYQIMQNPWSETHQGEEK